MKRGDIVTVAAPGDYGKPRPAVVIQSDWLAQTDSVLVALMTSAIFDAPILSATPAADGTRSADGARATANGTRSRDYVAEAHPAAEHLVASMESADR